MNKSMDAVMEPNTHDEADVAIVDLEATTELPASAATLRSSDAERMEEAEKARRWAAATILVLLLWLTFWT
jgi:hypothetical protein